MAVEHAIFKFDDLKVTSHYDRQTDRMTTKVLSSHPCINAARPITIKKWISIGKKLILTARDRLALTNELSDIRITARQRLLLHRSIQSHKWFANYNISIN